jgi:HEAT repeat protein
VTLLVWAGAAGFAALCVLAVLLLLVLRLLGDRRQSREQHRRTELRTVVLAMLVAEPQAAAEARRELLARPGRHWAAVEEQAFALLPKIRGEARGQLVGLLEERGAGRRARRLARSRSTVRRCRGAHRLGVLADPQPQPGTVPVLLDLLADRSFLVRRVAVRALGSVADPRTVRPLLRAVGSDARLTRDLVATVERIGLPGAGELREDLAAALERVSGAGRHAEVAVVCLGLLGDVSSADLLSRALTDGRRPALQAAAAEALGRIGAPQAVPDLLRSLTHDDPQVRTAAARALGDIGSAAAVPGLLRALDSADDDLARSVATALVRVEPSGERLAAHPSPYAAEAVALHRLRTAA